VSLAPLLLLLRRQAYCAFDVLSADQSYHAWLLLRPGVEAALIIGKWVDDPQNAAIWKDREKDRRAYQDTYTGRALRSTSLVGSDQIQGVLSAINDQFVHANLDYYYRHLKVDPGDPRYVNLALSYFEDDTLQVVNALAFLHLLLAVQEALLALFNKLFGAEVALPSTLTLFKQTYGDRIERLVREKDEYKSVLSDLGALNLTGQR
jgi:hypothetical protein